NTERNLCRRRRCKQKRRLGEDVARAGNQESARAEARGSGNAQRAECTGSGAAQAFGADRWFDDPFAMIRDDRIDLITIAVNVPAHRDLVQAALSAGKAVYCEAPLGRIVAEAEEMASAVGSLHTAI